MKSIRLFFLIISLFFLAFTCTREIPAVDKTGTEDTLTEGQKALAVVCFNGITILNDSMKEMMFIPVEDSIHSVSFNRHIFMQGKSTFEINLRNFELSDLGIIPESRDVAFIPEGRILLLKNAVIMNTKYSQSTLLKSEVPLTKIYTNPYHKYVYALDSLGYLYSIDYETRILKKKSFTGDIQNIGFHRFGSRIYINTYNNFMICDFETLNIIYKNNNSMLAYTETPLNNAAVLQINSRNILNSVNYKEIAHINFQDSICDIIANSDSLFALSDAMGKIFIYSGRKKLRTYDLKSSNIQMLSFDNNIIMINDSILKMVFSDRDSIINIDSIIDPVYSLLFTAPDSMPEQFVVADKSTFIEEVEKEIKKNTYYTVQLHSFTDITSAKNAESSAKDKIQKNIVFVKKAVVKNSEYYRVYAGKFTNREEAENLRELLIKIGYTSDIFVTAIYYENIVK